MNNIEESWAHYDHWIEDIKAFVDVELIENSASILEKATRQPTCWQILHFFFFCFKRDSLDRRMF